MKSLPALIAAGLLLAAAVAASTGCNQSTAVDTQQVQKYRTAFALEQEPDGAETVLQVRESLSGEAAHDHVHDHDSESAHHEEGDADQDHQEHADHDDEQHADHDHDDQVADDPENDAPATSDSTAGAADDDHDAAHHEQGDADHDHEHAEDHAHDDASAHHAEEHADDQGEHDHAEHDHADHGEHDHAAHGPSDERDVVMVGMVGGLPNAATQTLPEFPFVKDYAIVMLADPLAVVELEEGGHNHAPGEECAFCAAHAGDQSSFLATVKFTDEQGKVLSVDARKLFDLKVKDVVVVRGKARLDHDGTLVVDATGLYVRR